MMNKLILTSVMTILCVCSVTVNASSLLVGQGLGLTHVDHDGGSGYTVGAFDDAHPGVVDIAVVDGGIHVVSSTGITFYSYDAVGDTFTEGGSSNFLDATGIAVAADGSIYTSSSAGVNQWTYSGGAYTAGGWFDGPATDIAVDSTGAIHVAQSNGVSGWTYGGGVFTNTAWLGAPWENGSAITVDAAGTVHYGKHDGMAGLTYTGSSYDYNGNWFSTGAFVVYDIEIDEAAGMIWVASEGGVNALNKADYSVIASEGGWGPIDDVFVDSDGKTHLGKSNGMMGVDIAGDVIAYDGYSWYGANDGVNVITEIPEPATVALLGLGAMALIRRRK